MKRRKLLKNIGHLAMSSSYYYGVQSLLDVCMQANVANASELAEINYVNIQLPGAPPRWMFDQPLNPENKNFKAGSFGTAIEKSGSTFKAVHRDRKINFGGKDIWLPPVWSLKSAKLNQPLKDLLAHSLMIRGIDMEINSHTVNQMRIVRPVGNRPSIHGLVADRSLRPLAAVGALGARNTDAFLSEKGLSTIAVPQGNPVPSMISAFNGPIETPDEMDAGVQGIMESLDGDAFDRKMSSIGSEDQQMAAYKMFERNLGKLRSQWLGIYKKYQGIIAAEIRANFPDIMAAKPSGIKTEVFRYERNSTNFVLGDLKSKITNGTHINQMAQSFAFAEFALKEKLSSSVSVVATGATMNGLKDIGNLRTDQHFVGSVTSTFYTSLMYRALASCLLEFTNVLKGESLFDKTVIHVMSEFSRTPKKSGAGSDHGFNGASAMIISGMIDQPGLIGNIRKESENSVMRANYPGTYGESGPFFSGGGKIVNDDVVQTLCEMLEIRKVAVKGSPLVKKTGGRVTLSGKWGAKNV